MNLSNVIRNATSEGKLLTSTVENLTQWLNDDFLPEWALKSIQELIDREAWDELNNRFYKTIAFGTGGMRDKTIADVITDAEKGQPNELGCPEHTAVGSAMMNDFNVIRATIGLYNYCSRHLEKSLGYKRQPSLVIAHDVRHFSRHFCELTASTFTKLGGQAMIFEGPRSTPQLSFSVRYLKTTAGVVITASHNPPQYNGFKAYFSDGAQVVSPHAEGIIDEVYKVPNKVLSDFLDINLTQVTSLPQSVDDAYLEALEENVLDQNAFTQESPKVVFTAIHGTGGVASVPLMKKIGIDVHTVEEQDVMDGRFPSVKSPNPEEAGALEMALKKADEIGADILMGTDPDADRMGAAIRNNQGEMVLLTGNMIGSLLAEYRITKMKEMGIIPEKGSSQAALIKTFVTTPLQEAIAKEHGLKCINTLTGFKWIGEKLLQYEETLKEALLKDQGIALDYDKTPLGKRIELLLKYSTFYVFGGEESYGYLASDKVRDKDANAAVLMFCEMVASLKAQGKSVSDYLDSIYLRYGYHMESLLNIYYEGASGAAKIKNILESYRQNPPEQIGPYKVTNFKDFGTQNFIDADGKAIPKQDFYFLELDNGYRFAVRGSGTEPKIKFYIFARENVNQNKQLKVIKATTAEKIGKLKAAINMDARKRAEI